jgi:hypothetical protein
MNSTRVSYKFSYTVSYTCLILILLDKLGVVIIWFYEFFLVLVDLYFQMA